MILHIAATMLLSIGFVKTADKIDSSANGDTFAQLVDEQVSVVILPCGSSKKR